MNYKTSLFFAICSAAASNADGFTINAQSFQPIGRGFSVAVEETQNSFGVSGAAKVAEYAATHGEINAVGGWHDSESGNYFLDACIIFEHEEDARTFAAANNQLAFYDLEKGEEIRL